MTRPPTIPAALERASALHSQATVIDATPGGPAPSGWHDIAAAVLRLAGGLHALGIGPGARVATSMPNHRRHLEALIATMAAGATSHPVNMRLPQNHLAHVLSEAGDVVLVVDAPVVPAVAAVLREVRSLRHVVVNGDAEPARSELPGHVAVHRWEDLLDDASATPSAGADPDAPALLTHTGGTSGRPKGVLHTHRQLLGNAEAFSRPDALAITEEDTLFPAVPLCHALAWGLPVAAMLSGASLVLQNGQTDPESTATIVRGYGVTLGAGVPTIWERVRAVGASLTSSVAVPCRLVIGGATPSAALVRWLADAGLDILHCWGMTETAPCAVVGRVTGTDRPGRLAVGRPIAGVEVRVVGPAGEVVEEGGGDRVGELQVRGPWVATTYLDGTASADGGWLRTGDLVRVDPQGDIYVVDRLKDLIKSGGEWISSLELEGALRNLEGVVDAAVVGNPHPEWGERPVAFVVLAADRVTTEELLSGLAGEVPGWWVPDRLEIVAELPRTPLGKLDKKELRLRAQR